ncbi:hypothetical protein BDV95DRAFT_605788 [Massariosphaeria phaeospora]|uniref:Lysozyme-like domain-containing protein n=1 Tax=Massariosphaeria phaeospora TaxID=100035 RepID=A0A7C8IFY6_9PLEO|nr:hypothetical protein BDV95DRAFT_605788 [Massariosphaeria phaeospora]
MLFSIPLLVLSSFVLPGALASDAEIAANWRSTGMCAYYWKKVGKNNQLTDTCIEYCKNNGGHGYSECDLMSWKGVDLDTFDPSVKKQDEEGDIYVPAPCKCENKAVEAITKTILEVVVEGLKKLDNILCAIMLETFQFVVDAAITFVAPEARLAASVGRFVEGAKTFAENTLPANDYFDKFIGDVCGVPDWNVDIWDALTGAPDVFGVSIGCKKKNKSDCKEQPSRPAPSNKPEEKPKPSESKKDESSAAPSATPTPTPSPSDTPTPTPSSDAAPSTTPSPSSADPSATSSDSSASSSSTSDECGASATASAAACEASTPCDIKNPDEGGEDVDVSAELIRRNGYRSHRAFQLEKREPKKGNPCKSNDAYKTFLLQSDDYPSNGQLDVDVKAYGWEKQDNLCEYGWQSGAKRLPFPPTGTNKYDSEHVMEWQTVTDFFAKLQAKGATNYGHPEPSQGNKSVDFCTYWVESWSLEPGQGFSIANGPALDPWKHIAAAYPSNNNWKDEMIALQRNINAPAKANLFTDSIPMVWTETTMDKYVKTNRNKVLERLRASVGARKYLIEPKVKDIFKAQKTRMGTALDEIDKALESHPREKVDLVTGVKTTYLPWKKQNLLDEWNSYMDTKWDDAVKKSSKVLDNYIGKLDDAHCKNQAKKSTADKEFCERLKKVETQYKQATFFLRPW